MADNVEEKIGEGKSKRRIPCEVYSRIVGYLRPVQAWNEGKQQEFSERRTYDLTGCATDEEGIAGAGAPQSE